VSATGRRIVGAGLFGLVAACAGPDGPGECVDLTPAAPPVVLELGPSETRSGDIRVAERLAITVADPVDPGGDALAGLEAEVWQGQDRVWHAEVADPARRTLRWADGVLDGPAAAAGGLEPWKTHRVRVRALATTAAGCVAAGAWSPDASFRTDDGSASLFHPSQVADVHIDLPPASYAAIDAEAVPPGCVPFERSYHPGTVRVGGLEFAGAGVRAKGGCGSARPLGDKPGWKINFAWDDPAVAGCPAERRAAGLQRLTLNNMVQDPSLARERLAYRLYQAMNVPVPRAGYTRVWLGDEFLGLYLHVETIDRRMLARNFSSNRGMLYEGTYWCDLEAGNVGDDDSGCLTREFTPDPCDEPAEPGDDPQDFGPLRGFISALDALPAGGFYPAVQNLIDTDALFGLWAVEGLLAHWDGYVYEIRNNYRVYHDPGTGLWSIIPTGLDQTFQRPGFDVWNVSGRLARSCLAEPACEAAFAERLREVVDVAADLDLETDRARWQDLASALLADDPGRNFSPSSFAQVHAETRDFLLSRPAEVLRQLAARGY
jgi:hypothetical protein